jgi:hypothetical protein
VDAGSLTRSLAKLDTSGSRESKSAKTQRHRGPGPRQAAVSHARRGRKSEWPRLQLRSCLWIFEGNKPLHEMAATRWSQIASAIPIGRWVATTFHHDFHTQTAIGRWVSTTSTHDFHWSRASGDVACAAWANIGMATNPTAVMLVDLRGGNKHLHADGGDSMESDCVSNPHRSVGVHDFLFPSAIPIGWWVATTSTPGLVAR